MIELTDRIISPPKKFNDFMFVFNNKKDHSFESRLERVQLSKGKFRKALYPMMLKIKDNKFKQGIYGFVFNEFKVVVQFNPYKKCFKTLTLLTKNMRKDEFKVKYKIKISKWWK